jgi:hypothetical protein
VRASDVAYFESVNIPYLERWLSWEQIRIVGKLPLFAASYFAIVAIPIFFYFLDIFNKKVDTVRAWASAELQNNGANILVARTFLTHIQREPVPRLSELLLISTILLGFGSTIFALACPSPIQEFSRSQWRHQFQHSLIHYIPLTWTLRWLRIPCAICYLAGGLGVGIVIASKLSNVFIFILANS